MILYFSKYLNEADGYLIESCMAVYLPDVLHLDLLSLRYSKGAEIGNPPGLMRSCSRALMLYIIMCVIRGRSHGIYSSYSGWRVSCEE